MGPGLQPKPMGGTAFQRRSSQSRSSAPRMTSRRALSEDDSDTEHVGKGGGLHRAVSMNPPKREPRDGEDQFLIELSDLGSNSTTTVTVGQAVLGRPSPLLSSAESLSPWQTPEGQQGQDEDVGQQQPAEGQNEYDGWKHATAPSEDSDVRERLLP